MMSRYISVKNHFNVKEIYNIHAKSFNDIRHINAEEDKLDAKFNTKLDNCQSEVTQKTINE